MSHTESNEINPSVNSSSVGPPLARKRQNPSRHLCWQCGKQAIYSDATTRACYKHRKPGMVINEALKCCTIGCTSCASLKLTQPNGKIARFCTKHAPLEAVCNRRNYPAGKLCAFPFCTIQGSFVKRGIDRVFCRTHAPVGASRCPLRSRCECDMPGFYHNLELPNVFRCFEHRKIGDIASVKQQELIERNFYNSRVEDNSIMKANVGHKRPRSTTSSPSSVSISSPSESPFSLASSSPHSMARTIGSSSSSSSSSSSGSSGSHPRVTASPNPSAFFTNPAKSLVLDLLQDAGEVKRKREEHQRVESKMRIDAYRIAEELVEKQRLAEELAEKQRLAEELAEKQRIAEEQRLAEHYRLAEHHRQWVEYQRQMAEYQRNLEEYHRVNAWRFHTSQYNGFSHS